MTPTPFITSKYSCKSLYFKIGAPVCLIGSFFTGIGLLLGSFGLVFAAASFAFLVAGPIGDDSGVACLGISVDAEACILFGRPGGPLGSCCSSGGPSASLLAWSV